MTRDRNEKPHVADVAKACQPKPKAKPPELTRDQTLVRIGEINNELTMLYPEIVEIKEFLEPLEKLYVKLSNEKYRLELSIHEVKVIPLRTVRKPSARAIALQKEIDELTAGWSPEMRAQAKKKGLI